MKVVVIKVKVNLELKINYLTEGMLKKLTNRILFIWNLLGKTLGYEIKPMAYGDVMKKLV